VVVGSKRSGEVVSSSLSSFKRAFFLGGGDFEVEERDFSSEGQERERLRKFLFFLLVSRPFDFNNCFCFFYAYMCSFIMISAS